MNLDQFCFHVEERDVFFSSQSLLIFREDFQNIIPVYAMQLSMGITGKLFIPKNSYQDLIINRLTELNYF